MIRPESLAWADFHSERVTGIEPALSAWEADVLPLNYTRGIPNDSRTGDRLRAAMVARIAMTQTQSSLYGPDCPIEISRASMLHRWDLLTFLHWSYDPSEVQRLLPKGLEVDTYDGRAWVGLVPFMMEVRAPRGPALPWLSHFCETNVRTYVTAPDGTRGVWFLSLDATRLLAVLTARSTYRLPYFWSAMSLDESGGVYTYDCVRRWPPPTPASSLVKMRIGAPYDAVELTPFDHFLTARWRLYGSSANGLRYALAQHDPWPPNRAELIDIDDSLVTAAGLSPPADDPICHWSPGVAVRIGFPHGVPLTVH